MKLCIVALLIFVGVGCSTPLTDAQVRQLATRYRDQWIEKNAGERKVVLSQTEIRSVERIADGWHVQFYRIIGDQPEGLEIFSIDVYLTPKGELRKVDFQMGVT